MPAWEVRLGAAYRNSLRSPAARACPSPSQARGKRNRPSVASRCTRASRVRRWLHQSAAPDLSADARLFAIRGRCHRDGDAARIGRAHARAGIAGASLLHSEPVARGSGVDGGNGVELCLHHRLLATASRRDRGNAQSVERRCQRLPAARARHARAARARGSAHRLVCALQPRRRVARRRRRAVRGHSAMALGTGRDFDVRGVAGNVRRICAAWRCLRHVVSKVACTNVRSGRLERAAATPEPANRLLAGRALQPGCLCRRLHRPVDARAVAVRAFPVVACHGGRDLLLDRCVFRILVSRRREKSPTGSDSCTRWFSRTCRPASC